MITVKFAKTVPGSQAVIPEKREEDAGYDIYACFSDKYLRIKAHETKLVPTGIASIIPPGYYFQIEERGSTGSKGMKKSAGVIDSGYRGEWFIAITNTNDKDIILYKPEPLYQLKCFLVNLDMLEDVILYPCNKAIAQAVLHAVPQSSVEEISYDELVKSDSERGTGKLGGSGK